VGLGRPILWALAAAGEQGIRDLFSNLTRELARLMTMVGASEPGKGHPGMLITPPGNRQILNMNPI
jgi:4-hydroxymandelate oxidase